jgi:hypothetical protein
MPCVFYMSRITLSAIAVVPYYYKSIYCPDEKNYTENTWLFHCPPSKTLLLEAIVFIFILYNMNHYCFHSIVLLSLKLQVSIPLSRFSFHIQYSCFQKALSNRFPALQVFLTDIPLSQAHPWLFLLLRRMKFVLTFLSTISKIKFCISVFICEADFLLVLLCCKASSTCVGTSYP